MCLKYSIKSQSLSVELALVFSDCLQMQNWTSHMIWKVLCIYNESMEGCKFKYILKAIK